MTPLYEYYTHVYTFYTSYKYHGRSIGEGGVADPSLTDQDLHQLVIKLATDTEVGPGSRVIQKPGLWQPKFVWTGKVDQSGPSQDPLTDRERQWQRVIKSPCLSMLVVQIQQKS